MMATSDIRRALRAPIKNGSLAWPIDWPNVGLEPNTKPRLEVEIRVASRLGGTLAGNEVDREDGFIAVTAVIEEGLGEDPAADMIDAVRALYFEGQQIAITGGIIQILDIGDVQSGFRARDREYHLPVSIRYRATST